jgi:putative molybdopterin biosynthesis protein
LDEETGEYNASWVRRLLPGRQVRLLTLAWRQQGLILRPGNPKKIGGLEGLFHPGVVFINRQRGSGTRVLLDYLLRRGGLKATGITGYDREEGSHLGVASAVASGAADAGLGLQAAAGALGLEFVPVAEERYDLAFLPELDADPRLVLLREILAGDPEFREAAMSLGGYDLRDTGKEVTL